MNQAPSGRRLDIQPAYLSILVVPVAVYLLLEFILKGFGDADLALPTSGFAEPAQMLELIGRYKFLAAFAFFGAVSISILLIFCLDLVANYTRPTIIYALIAIVISAAFGVVLSVLEPEAFGSFETYYLLGRDFFEAGLSLGATSLCAAEGADCIDRGALSMFRILTNPINALTSFGAAAALTGLILSLSRPAMSDAKSDRDPAARAAELMAAQAVSQRYLYCAGLLLTAGITFLLAWMYWPSALIADAAIRQTYLDLVGAISLYIGVGYSVMILSCYLPVMLIHMRRLERFRADMPGTVAAAKDKTAGAPALPELSYIKALNSMVAILSPILASAIGSFGQGVLFA